MEWRQFDSRLKPRRGKRIPCRVSNTDSAVNILIKAENKWRTFFPDLYDSNENYRLIYEITEFVLSS